MDPFFIIFPGVWALVGAIFTAIGVGMTANRRQKEQYCTMCTQGTVVDLVHRSSYHMDKYRSAAWYPVFSYYAGGRQIEKLSPFGSSSPQFTVGETVELYYDPDNVERYYVAGDSLGRLLGSIFTWVGIACLSVAALVLAVGFFILR